jgi:hypothetical protein
MEETKNGEHKTAPLLRPGSFPCFQKFKEACTVEWIYCDFNSLPLKGLKKVKDAVVTTGEKVVALVKSVITPCEYLRNISHPNQ